MTKKGTEGFDLLNVLNVNYWDEEIRPTKIEGFEDGQARLEGLKGQDIRLNNKKIISIVKGTLKFANTRKELFYLWKWITPRNYTDRLIIKKIIEIAETEEELDKINEETMVFVHHGLWDLWNEKMTMINPERILSKELQKNILRIAFSCSVKAIISEEKEGDKHLENEYYLIEATTQRKRSFLVPFLKVIGLARNIKPKNTELTMAITSIEEKELFLVSPERDYEEWFGNFLNSLKEEGWKIFQYEYITRGR